MISGATSKSWRALPGVELIAEEGTDGIYAVAVNVVFAGQLAI
jgi:hypothetical protein